MIKKSLSIFIISMFLVPVVLFNSDIFYPKESDIRSMTVDGTKDHDVATIKTKDGKCLMYQLKDGKTIGFKTCPDNEWQPVN